MALFSQTLRKIYSGKRDGYINARYIGEVLRANNMIVERVLISNA